MTSEAKITNSLRLYFREHAPEGVYFKHADRATLGMPDSTLTADRRTLWLEVKVVTPDKHGLIKARLIVDGSTHGKLQLQWMCRLERAGLARYAVFSYSRGKW